MSSAGSGQTKFVNHYVRPFITDTPEKGYTMVILTVITIIVFGQFALLPAVNSVIKTSNALSEGGADSQKLATKIVALRKAQDNLTQYQPQITLLEAAQIGAGDSGKIIASLTRLCEKNNVRLNFYQKETASGGGVNTISFWIGVGGEFNSLVNFIKGVNSFLPTATVESINLTKDRIVQATILINIKQI